MQRMDPSDRLEFDPVTPAGHHLHCYLDNYHVARITLYADHCGIDGPGFAPCHVPTEDAALEVVKMCVRLGTGRGISIRRSDYEVRRRLELFHAVRQMDVAKFRARAFHFLRA